MADTLVERLTGQTQAGDVDVVVGVAISVDALLDPDSGETVLGHGPPPATSTTSTQPAPKAPQSLSTGAPPARGNQVREIPGWTGELVHDGLGDQPHTVRTTTPIGHTYTSRAGP